MAASDEEEVPLSVKERARLLNSRSPDRGVDLVKGTRSAPSAEESIPPVPEKTPVFRPHLSQFGAKSEELLRATRSGVVDIAGKGRNGFLEATDSIKEFIARPKSSNGGAAISTPEDATVPFPLFEDEAGESREISLIDVSTEDGRNEQLSASHASGMKPSFKWKMPDFDRQGVSNT